MSAESGKSRKWNEKALSNLYFLTWALFAVAALGFLAYVLARKPDTIFGVPIERALTATLIMSVHTLVTINTVVLILEVALAIARPSELNETNGGLKEKMKRKLLIAFLLIVASIACSGAAAYRGFTEGIRGFEKEGEVDIAWMDVLRDNETLCVFLFLSFVLAGGCLRSVCSNALSADSTMSPARRDEVAEFCGRAKLYYVACDLPGLIGASLIWVCGWVLRESNPHFVEGFIAGAMGLHVAFSQASLAFLGFFEGKDGCILVAAMPHTSTKT